MKPTQLTVSCKPGKRDCKIREGEGVGVRITKQKTIHTNTHTYTNKQTHNENRSRNVREHIFPFLPQWSQQEPLSNLYRAPYAFRSSRSSINLPMLGSKQNHPDSLFALQKEKDRRRKKPARKTQQCEMPCPDSEGVWVKIPVSCCNLRAFWGIFALPCAADRFMQG